MVDKEKSKELTNLINSLSKESLQNDDTQVWASIATLQHIYIDQFRHLYSDIFATISQNNEDENICLLQNVSLIHEKVQSANDCKEPFKKAILKLFDHINLDVARINYLARIEEINKRKTDTLISKLNKAEQQLKEQNEYIHSMQKEYISILGIFSAIVITFVAGLVFTSSVLQNIEKSSIYRLALVIWVLGYGLTITLKRLFDIIKNIHTANPQKNGYILDKHGPFKKIAIKIRKNIFFIVLLLILIAWFIDVVGIRNRINEKLYNSCNSVNVQEKTIEKQQNPTKNQELQPTTHEKGAQKNTLQKALITYQY